MFLSLIWLDIHKKQFLKFSIGIGGAFHVASMSFLKNSFLFFLNCLFCRKLFCLFVLHKLLVYLGVDHSCRVYTHNLDNNVQKREQWVYTHNLDNNVQKREQWVYTHNLDNNVQRREQRNEEIKQKNQRNIIYIFLRMPIYVKFGMNFNKKNHEKNYFKSNYYAWNL